MAIDLKGILCPEDYNGLKFTNEAVAKAVEKKREKDAEKAGEFLVGFLDKIQDSTKYRVEALKRARQVEKKAKKNLDEANRAAAYFAETNNPYPFLLVIHSGKKGYVNIWCNDNGLGILESDDPLWDIPADFKYDAAGK